MRKIYTLLCSLLLCLVAPFSVKDVDATTQEDAVGFSVQAVLPDNQTNADVTYFDLLVSPGDEQVLEVQIFNHENQTLKVNVTPTTASTNRNALIVYEPQETYDDSLAYPISELITVEDNQITVPANDMVTVELKLTVPEEPFDGIMLGGLHFEKEPTEEEAASEGVQIDNRYAYVVGLQIRENDAVIEPNLTLKGIQPSLVNYRTAVIAEIQNDQPTIIGDLKIDAKVYKEDGSEPIKTAQIDKGQFAPNSTMDFTIDWENEYLAPGNYRLEMVAQDGQGNEWQWEEPFTITDDQAKISDDAVVLEEDSWFTPQIFIIIIIVLILIIVLLIYKLKQRK